jgi:Domain of unknown function (DUF1816)
MTQSMMVFGLGIFLGLVIILQITIKASIDAWQNRSLSTNVSENSWGWWIELRTLYPDYVYYFGPFLNKIEVQKSKFGYIQDLESEGSKVISIHIKWCKPSQLTIPIEESLKAS